MVSTTRSAVSIASALSRPRVAISFNARIRAAFPRGKPILPGRERIMVKFMAPTYARLHTDRRLRVHQPMRKNAIFVAGQGN